MDSSCIATACVPFRTFIVVADGIYKNACNSILTKGNPNLSLSLQAGNGLDNGPPGISCRLPRSHALYVRPTAGWARRYFTYLRQCSSARRKCPAAICASIEQAPDTPLIDDHRSAYSRNFAAVSCAAAKRICLRNVYGRLERTRPLRQVLSNNKISGSEVQTLRSNSF